MNALPSPLNRLRRTAPRRAPAEWSSTFTWGGAMLLAWFVFATMPGSSQNVLLGGATGPLHVVHGWQRMELAILVAAPVVVCRRWPLAALAGTQAGAVLLAVLGLPDSVLMLGGAALVTVVTARRPRWIGLGAAVGTFALWSVLIVVGDPRVHGYGRLGDVAMVLTVAFIGGVLIRERRERGRERREHGRALREQAAAGAVTAERLRIARELHDMVAHSIGIVAIQAGAARRCIRTQPVLAAEALEVIETTSRETLTGLRHLLVALREAEGDRDGLAPAPGLADLPALADNAAKAGVAVRVRIDGERRVLPAEVDLSAYRIVQESLTNVVRHAGTGQCRVAIAFQAREVVIEVTDDGRGVLADAPRGSGFGLAGMRERVSLLHGSFDAGPRAEGGFRVRARIPA